MTTVGSSTAAPSGFVFPPKQRKRAIVAAVIWFFVCLFYGAPASLFSTILRTAVPQLQLQNISGSFWNGYAAQAFWLQNPGQPNSQTIALGSFEWHLQPWSLLWLHPSAHIATSYGEQFIDARLRVSPLGSVVLNKASAAMPAALISNWLPVAVRGQIALKLERAELSHAQISAMQGAVYWQQAQWQWNTHWLALGDYRCELSTSASQQIHCALQGQGQLAIDGGVDVDSKARTWAAQLQMTIASSLPDDFRQSIQLMLAAEPDAQGKFSVKKNGHW